MGRRLLGGPGGNPCALAAFLATREDIDTTAGDQRSSFKPSDLPHYCASDLKVPSSYKETMGS